MKTNVDVKVNVKRKYKFEGKEYDSIEDIPAEAREAFRKASAESGGEAGPNQTKITYKGQEYDLNDLPPIVRKVYEKLMEKAQKEQGAIEPSSASEIEDIPEPTADNRAGEMPAEPITPTATSPAARFILSLVALGAIFLLIYFLRR